MVPLLDLTRQYQSLKPELEAAALKLLESCHYILGPAVTDFEANAARNLGVKHAIGVANGTDALQIALMALGVGPGDEVITTPFTFFATAEVVSLLGAVPIFVDIDAATYNIDPALIEAAITPRTKAIIPVHLFGNAGILPDFNGRDALLHHAFLRDLYRWKSCLVLPCIARKIPSQQYLKNPGNRPQTRANTDVLRHVGAKTSACFSAL